MTLEEALAVVNECMTKLESIPWPDPHAPGESETPFYPPADDHLARAHQELDEAHGQLGSAVRFQKEHVNP